MRVGYFPFKPGGNPYQTLFANALEEQGLIVDRIPPTKYFPLSKAASRGNDILQLDWPHDWYTGRNRWTQWMKRVMYEVGLAKLRRIPVVWTVHNLVAHDTEHPDYDRRMIQKLIDVCDGIICLSQIAREELSASYSIPEASRVRVIPHGHYQSVYPNTVSRAQARKALQFQERDRVILNFGRILPYKGIEDLIDSFFRIKNGDARLVIAGSCMDPAYLQSLNMRTAGDTRIRIVPEFIVEAQLQYYFNSADVVALPFRNVLNSGTLLLAMSFGKCVAAPDIGSIKEIALEAGWYPYKTGSTEDLAYALGEALDTVDSEREKRVLEYTTSRFDWDRIGESVSFLYNELRSS